MLSIFEKLNVCMVSLRTTYAKVCLRRRRTADIRGFRLNVFSGDSYCNERTIFVLIHIN